MLSKQDYQSICTEEEKLTLFIENLKSIRTDTATMAQFQLGKNISLFELLKRPQINDSLLPSIPALVDVPNKQLHQAIIHIRYEGYIIKQKPAFKKRMPHKSISQKTGQSDAPT